MTELSRRERERLRHRGEMLEAAEKLFSQKGFHVTTMQEIAAEADFSVGALYGVFESKLDLYFQLIDMRADEFFELVSRRMESAQNSLEKIRVVISSKLNFFKEHKQFFRVFSHVTGPGRSEQPSVMSADCLNKYMQYQEKLRKIIQAGINDGTFAKVDPLLMVLCLEGITNAMIGRWIHTGGRDLDEARPEEIERVFLRGILAESYEQ